MDWNFRNDLPIYSQLVEQIRLAVVAGEYPPGARLASVRDLAMEAGVNPNTMQRALQELEREGILYSQRTAGRFVTEDTAVIDRAKQSLAREQIRLFREAMHRLGYSREQALALLREEKEEQEHADP
ncbi:MAG: GntR family transcriptional regulator [Oscillospiraceae bacterium]|nr:GntR family transcriptional regulator [Oscillospiraceae bacterium]